MECENPATVENFCTRHGFKFGDDLGGNGWVVPLADGTVQIFYVAVPEGYPIKTTLHFENPPPPPEGADGDTSIQALAQHYVSTLGALVGRAKCRFG